MFCASRRVPTAKVAFFPERQSRSVQLLIAKDPLVAKTVAPQLFDFADGTNAAACARRRAVQPRRGAAKLKYLWKGIAAQQGIGEAA